MFPSAYQRFQMHINAYQYMSTHINACQHMSTHVNADTIRNTIKDIDEGDDLR